jgi:hypothetical protein
MTIPEKMRRMDDGGLLGDGGRFSSLGCRMILQWRGIST